MFHHFPMGFPQFPMDFPQKKLNFPWIFPKKHQFPMDFPIFPQKITAQAASQPSPLGLPWVSLPTSVAPWSWPWPPWPPPRSSRSSPLRRRAAAPWRRPRCPMVFGETTWEKNHREAIKNPSKTNQKPTKKLKSDEIR